MSGATSVFQHQVVSMSMLIHSLVIVSHGERTEKLQESKYKLFVDLCINLLLILKLIIVLTAICDIFCAFLLFVLLFLVLLYF